MRVTKLLICDHSEQLVDIRWCPGDPSHIARCIRERIPVESFDDLKDLYDLYPHAEGNPLYEERK